MSAYRTILGLQISLFPPELGLGPASPGIYPGHMNPAILEIIDFALMLTSMPLTEEVHGLIEKYEAGEMTLEELISIMQTE